MLFDPLVRVAAVLVLPAMGLLAAQRAPVAPPIFPGAAPDAAAAQEWGEAGPGNEVKVYSTSAPIEEVFRFYKAQLGAVPSGGNSGDFSALRPGASTPVFFDLVFHQSPPAAHAAALKANRPPFDGGQWIENATLTWGVKASANQFTSLTVQLEDRSFNDGRYRQKTLIVIQREGDNAVAAPSRDDRNAEEARPRRAIPPPPAAELGAPLYPGAVFDGDASAGLTQPGGKVYIYLSTDMADKVAAFYASKLGVTTTRDADGRYLIPLRGGLPLPDWGIEIMPNLLFDKKYKSVITFASWTPYKGR